MIGMWAVSGSLSQCDQRLEAATAGHQNIEGDGVWPQLASLPKSLGSGADCSNLIFRLQVAGQEFAGGHFVIDDHHEGPGAARNGGDIRVGWLHGRLNLGGSRSRGESKSKFAALSGFALHRNLTVLLLDEALGDREPQSGAFTGGSGVASTCRNSSKMMA